MATINECEKAIWMYNDFPTGEFKLRVKFSKTEEERNRQAREKQVISLLKIFLTKIILQSKINVASNLNMKEKNASIVHKIKGINDTAKKGGGNPDYFYILTCYSRYM